MVNSACTILVTGCTGYIGGRLVPRLLNHGYQVRCLVRDPERLRNRPWSEYAEIVTGDALDLASLRKAMKGIEVAYYLISPLNDLEKQFVDRNHRAATNFGLAAKMAGIKRIIYLGRIRPKSERYSSYLLSRLHTGDLLRRSKVPITEFRVGVIIGSGSLSFELIRYVTERVPVLVVPRWVHTKTQPIAVRNVLDYLVSAIDVEESVGKIIEIGGEEILTYADMIRMYADIRGLRRRVLSVPVATPRLSALWVSMATPIGGSVAHRLIEHVGNEVVLTNDAANQLFNVKLVSFKDAARRALNRFAKDQVDTMWTDAVSSTAEFSINGDTLSRKEGLIKERRHTRAEAPPASVFSILSSIGGDTGWLYANALWKIRGIIDLLAGGVGLRKTRRSYSKLRVGDTVDFWRVEALDEDRLLRLRAEMKIPGKAWLQYNLSPLANGHTRITQTAYYEPKGLLGSLYWYLFYIPHLFIFPGMLRELKRRAEKVNGQSNGTNLTAETKARA